MGGEQQNQFTRRIRLSWHVAHSRDPVELSPPDAEWGEYNESELYFYIDQNTYLKAYIGREVSRIQYFRERKMAGTGPEEKTITEQDLTELVTDEDLEKDFKEYLQLEAQLVVKLNVHGEWFYLFYIINYIFVNVQ